MDEHQTPAVERIEPLGPPADAPVEPVGDSLHFSTTLRSRDFLVISLVNGLLNLVTLTLYRFWGKTEVRRRVWRGVRVNGEAFEYTGRGVELFVGFILAVVALGVPFLALVFAVQFLDPAFILLLFPLYLVMFWLFGFGMFTAFRYMASRTTWRGVRFALKGSAVKYGLTYLGMLVASFFTAGWLWPLAQRMLASQVWGELRFGDRKFRWVPHRSEEIGIYGPFALGWLGSIVLYFVAVLGFMGVVFALGLAPDVVDPSSREVAPDPAALPEIGFVLALYGYMILVLPLFALIWAPYQSALLRSLAAGVALDDARFRLKVGSLSLWWLTCTNIVFLVLSFGILLPLIQARTAKYLVSRLTSTGDARLEAARQAGAGPKTAEGLADAFGFSFI